jgi:hypothetical protein
VVGFFRPQRRGCVGKPYQSEANTALPALARAVGAAVGSVGQVRVPLRRRLVRADPDHGREAARPHRAVTQAGATVPPAEVRVVDAGFGVADRLTSEVPRFVARVARTLTARRHKLPPDKGRGRCPIYGARVRPLARTRQGQRLAATPPEATAQWGGAGRRVRAQIGDNLVLANAKPGPTACRGVVLHDPRDHAPWGVATHLPVSAAARWGRYRDRWPIEPAPLAAKQILGADRACVFGNESRSRLPELALLAGNILADVAATTAAVATGLWDRHCRPTCGRLRRVLVQGHFSEVSVPAGALRKKASVTGHLPKGVQGQRRRKGSPTPLTNRLRQQKVA